MRLVDANELIERAWRDKLDSRELIVKMIEQAPTVKSIPTQIPIEVYERLLTKTEPCEDVVSRKAVMKAIEEVGLLTCEYIDVKQAIESLPSVNPTLNASIQITEREKYGRFN